MADHSHHGHRDVNPHPPGSQGPHDSHGTSDHGQELHSPEYHVDFPTWKTYRWVALILVVITGIEVWVYYIPSFVASRLFVPSLLFMSAVNSALNSLASYRRCM
jgi:hypothetical protein